VAVTKRAGGFDRARWEPIRRGPIYCAPACGGGCTWAAYQLGETATTLKALARLLAKLARVAEKP
jgi:hypothetical protein